MDVLRGFLADLLHLPLIVKVGLLWMAGAAAWSWRKQRLRAEMVAASATWPVYRARVIAAQVLNRKRSDEDKSPYLGLLTYSYTVPGSELEVGEFRKSFFDEGEADAWAAGLKNGFVDVRVDPADARRSVWDETAYVPPPLARVAVTDMVRLGAERETWRGTAMLVVFCVSAAGAALSAAIQCSCLLGRPLITAQRNFAAFSGMQVGAILCGIAGQYLTRSRGLWPRRSGGDPTLFKTGTSRPLWTKLLAAYSVVMFFYGWVRMAAGTHAPGSWPELMFSAIWLEFFVETALACWRGMHPAD